jgi:hypothetical protein
LSRIVKVILFLIFFGIFFEAGLFASYTIVTQQQPDVGKLIGMQINAISSIFNIGGPIIPNHHNLNILNPEEVADSLKTKASVDGVNVQSIAAQTIQNTKGEGTVNVNITAMGYKDIQTGGGVGNQSGGVIVIKPNETYSIIAIAVAKTQSGGVQIDVDSIKITSTRKLYNNP